MDKLLFITQKIDKDDDVLGVYHRWVECLGEKIGKLNVVCLYKGRSELSSKIGVFSLGKEIYNADLRIKCESTDCGYKENQQSASSAYHSHNQHHNKKRIIQRLIYAIRFYRYIWNLRNNYDVVFVHMNPIYIILGGLFWKLSGKKIFLWYNHPMGNLMARFGIFFADKVFCTSPFSFAARYDKSILMPVGIDTSFFKRNDEIVKIPGSVVFLSRISPIKRLETLLAAARILANRGAGFNLAIVGSALSEIDKKYEIRLKSEFDDLIGLGIVSFRPGVPNSDTGGIYNASEIFINLTPTGSFDKSIIEAMACETLVLASNRVLEAFFDDELKEMCMFKEGDSDDLAVKIYNLLSAGDGLKKNLREKSRKIAVEKHSLDRLINVLLNELS